MPRTLVRTSSTLLALMAALCPVDRVHAQGVVNMPKLSAPLANAAASLTLARNEGSTKDVSERMAKAPPSTVPPTQLPNVTYAVGGVTLVAGGAAIGAIGVSGAPGGQLDEDCARAAIAKIQDRMK